jgi:membrane associated rhomboid family serine protease
MIPLRDDQPTFSTPFVNYFLIVLNAVIFLWELSVGMQSHRALNSFLVEFGVVPHHTLAVLTGHSYDGIATAILPLFTSMFLHASFLHVAGNMLFLWIFGDNIEDILGHFKFLLFYLMCGVAAGMAHLFFNFGSHLPTVGASGAIAGVMGAYMVKFPRARILTLVFIFFFITTFEVPAFLMLIYWFVIQLFSGVGSIGYSHLSEGGVAWFAHVGGFVAGIVFVNMLGARQAYSRRRDLRW